MCLIILAHLLRCCTISTQQVEYVCLCLMLIVCKLQAGSLIGRTHTFVVSQVGAIASTGVTYISVGSLTHSVKALDVSLKIQLSLR